MTPILVENWNELPVQPVPVAVEPVERKQILALDCAILLHSAKPGPHSGAIIARFADFGIDMLQSVRPDLIVLPLFAPAQDAVTMIETLIAIGYQGDITVLAPALPRPSLVERELRALGPGNKLRLLVPNG